LNKRIKKVFFHYNLGESKAQLSLWKKWKTK
jgi:hypothetical protein